MNRIALLVAAAATASSVSAQTGQVLFSTLANSRTGGVEQDIIGLLDTATPGVFNTLYTATAADSRLSRLARGPGNSFVIGDAPFPSNPGVQGDLLRFDNLLAGGASPTTVIDGGTNLGVSAIVGLQYNSAANGYLWVNNPAATGVNPNPTDGVFFANADGTGITQLVMDTGNPAPSFRAGVEVKADPLNPNSYYVTSLNGGTGNFGDGDANQSSAIWRLDLNTANPGSSAFSLVTALDSASTGLGEDINFSQGITFDASGNLIISDRNNNKIYRGDTDGAGGVTGWTEIADLGALQTNLGLDFGEIEDIEYNAFDNTLVFVEGKPQFDPDIGRISTINLDGTGYQILLDDVYVRDVFVVPTPASAAILGLGGLAAVRRRR